MVPYKPRMPRDEVVFLLVFVVAFLGMAVDAWAGQKAAYRHLDTVMDEFSRTFDVFTDLGAAGNHFAARCAMVRNPGDPADLAGVTLDETWTENCHSGATCIKNTFSAVDGQYWGGWTFQSGVLSGCESQPRCDWGNTPGAGHDLSGAKKVTFWARGERAGDGSLPRIEFFVCGIGGTETCNRVPSAGKITRLTTKWKKYTISLRRQDLGVVVGGFGWVANALNNPKGATFYLDDITYHKRSPNVPRFLLSYATLPAPAGSNFDNIHKNVAFTYDNVLALLAYLARGRRRDLQRARLLADALVYAQEHDRYYDDGRLRNAYQGGDLVVPPGWMPNNRKATARLPGWWDPVTNQWVENVDALGTSTGNMAWAMIGLLRAYQTLGDARYLHAAERLGSWVEQNTRDERGAGGYTGGVVGGEPTCGDPPPTLVTWKSTEHNIDLYVAFMTLFDLTEDPKWRERALHAKRFVEAMWEACGEDHFAVGTTQDGSTPNCISHPPEDVNTWGLMTLGQVSTYGPGIAWVQENSGVSEPCFRGRPATGIDFNSDKDGIWWEGTAHAAVAKWITGERDEARLFVKNLRKAQRVAPNANKKGIVTTCRDGVTTGIDGFLLFNRLHVGATAWYIFAERRYNPFWGIGTEQPIPHEGE